MTLEIFKGYPPDSEFPIAEICHRHDGVVDIPAEVRRENGQLRITIFGHGDGVGFDYLLDDWVAALNKAAEALGEG